MGTARGDSEKTKSQILEAARALFAEHGIAATSVRDIAQAAGVTHRLVQHYFGSREDLVAEVIRREVHAGFDAASSIPDTDPAQLDSIPQMIRHYLTDGRTSALIISHAALEGFEPESMLAETAIGPLQVLAARLAERQAQADATTGARRLDPAMVSAYIGAAVIALGMMHPWLSAAVGLQDESYEEWIEQTIAISVALAAITTGAGPKQP